MSLLVLFDVAPDPVMSGVGIAIVLFVIGFVILLLGASAMILLLWYRRRRMHTVEIARAEVATMASAIQPNNPSQP